jgi:16S rRNA (uracil1498-N3)-methyltransferase
MMAAMKRVRVFAREAPRRWMAGEQVELQPDQLHYLRKVLRLSGGDELAVSDGRGQRWQARLAKVSGTMGAELLAPLTATPESPIHIRLVQAISSADKMDWSIEKSVELGVDEIFAVQSQRSVVKLGSGNKQRKLAHWQAIVEAAAMQSGRDVLPVMHEVKSLETTLGKLDALEGPKVVLQPGGSTHLGALGKNLHEITLAIGPEAGWSEDEMALFAEHRWISAALGPRVLRSETAAPAALATLQTVYGDFFDMAGLHSKA